MGVVHVDIAVDAVRDSVVLVDGTGAVVVVRDAVVVVRDAVIVRDAVVIVAGAVDVVPVRDNAVLVVIVFALKA